MVWTCDENGRWGMTYMVERHVTFWITLTLTGPKIFLRKLRSKIQSIILSVLVWVQVAHEYCAIGLIIN